MHQFDSLTPGNNRKQGGSKYIQPVFVNDGKQESIIEILSRIPGRKTPGAIGMEKTSSYEK